MAASPGRSAGSSAAPAGRSSSVFSTGTSRCSTVQTRSPLASTRRRISGKVKVGSGPRAGSLERSTVITTPRPGRTRRAPVRSAPCGTTLSAMRRFGWSEAARFGLDGLRGHAAGTDRDPCRSSRDRPGRRCRRSADPICRRIHPPSADDR